MTDDCFRLAVNIISHLEHIRRDQLADTCQLAGRRRLRFSFFIDEPVFPRSASRRGEAGTEQAVFRHGFRFCDRAAVGWGL